MKKLGIYLLFVFSAMAFPAVAASKNAPDWITSKPAVEGYYTGVGSAPLAADGYDDLAKKRALTDLLSEIEILIENQSLLQRIDDNGEYSERYTNDIRSQAKAWLEGYELADTYNDGSQYWVYYRLDRNKYEQLRRKRSSEAATTALDLWIKGRAALKEGRFPDAADLFAKGIKAIEPFSNQRLEVEHDGRKMNIGAELHSSLSGMFSRLAITATPSKIEMEPLGNGSKEVSIRVVSGTDPVRGVKLKASFDTGTANVNVLGPTDNTGHTRIVLSELSAKPAVRHLTITPIINLDGIFDTPTLAALGDRLKTAITPITITVTVSESEMKAMVRISDRAAEQLARQIAVYVNNNYFDIVSDETEADLAFDIETTFRSGGIEKGTMYNLREYFTSATVTVTDLRKKAVVASAVITDMRSLAPEKTAATKARGDAYRNLLKKLKKELDRQLSTAKFERRSSDSSLPTTESYKIFFNQ